VVGHFLEGSGHEPIDQEGCILNREYLVGVILVIVLAAVTKHPIGMGTIGVHADKGIGGHLSGGLFCSVMLGADEETRHVNKGSSVNNFIQSAIILSKPTVVVG
jgi:hypothetical protein